MSCTRAVFAAFVVPFFAGVPCEPLDEECAAGLEVEGLLGGGDAGLLAGGGGGGEAGARVGAGAGVGVDAGGSFGIAGADDACGACPDPDAGGAATA